MEPYGQPARFLRQPETRHAGIDIDPNYPSIRGSATGW
jgi:hypothetical protein